MAVSIQQTELTIEAWINGRNRHTSALHTDGCDIFSYAMPLLIKEPTYIAGRYTYWLMDTKPNRSVTTSQHYNRLVSTLKLYGMRDALDGFATFKREIKRGWDTYTYRQIIIPGMP